ncbi:hypothetical protein CONLIGDRAFT_684853 [Coniochaeta ligniaria NRRL 30616]|uniref:Peptidase M16 C-terminal domain-containing protein n=1 Tax=Coniochaeta ligniaria NRRL 30616 TaxID=1408157 RepID=A0A1J7IBX2_9PEZI|nr:hypothetical protein CONLIGDRAFT_684853 [Coniochaeta ligniaria NRRL 30616]
MSQQQPASRLHPRRLSQQQRYFYARRRSRARRTGIGGEEDNLEEDEDEDEDEDELTRVEERDEEARMNELTRKCGDELMIVGEMPLGDTRSLLGLYTLLAVSLGTVIRRLTSVTPDPSISPHEAIPSQGSMAAYCAAIPTASDAPPRPSSLQFIPTVSTSSGNNARLVHRVHWTVSGPWRHGDFLGVERSPSIFRPRWWTGTYYGVLKTEPEARGVNVREKFIEFYEKHYSANRMKLCVIGREPLDVPQTWVVELFSNVKNKGLKQIRWTESVPFTEEQLGTLVFAKPCGTSTITGEHFFAAVEALSSTATDPPLPLMLEPYQDALKLGQLRKHG